MTTVCALNKRKMSTLNIFGTNNVILGVFFIKGTVLVIPSDLPFTECNARFSKIPFRPYVINNVADIIVFQA